MDRGASWATVHGVARSLTQLKWLSMLTQTRCTALYFYKTLNLFFFYPPQALNFLFCIGVQLIKNVVVVSGEQRRDSAIYNHVSILPKTPLPSRLAHNIRKKGWVTATFPAPIHGAVLSAKLIHIKLFLKIKSLVWKGLMFIHNGFRLEALFRIKIPFARN